MLFRLRNKLLIFLLCSMLLFSSTHAGNADDCVAVVQDGNQFIFVNKCSVRVKIVVEFGYVGRVDLQGMTATYPVDLNPHEKVSTGLTIYQFYVVSYQGVYL